MPFCLFLRYLDYAQGYNLTNRMPLFVTAKGTGAISLNDTMWLMRTRFTGTWFDERSDVGAGPFHAEYRQRPLMWTAGGKKYAERAPPRRMRMPGLRLHPPTAYKLTSDHTIPELI